MPGDVGDFTVTHVAHTTEKGGAELALARLLGSPCRSWRAVLLVPAGSEPGAFAALGRHDVRIVEAGAAQRPGASRASWGSGPGFAWRLLRQAVAARRSGAFAGADVVHANSTRAAVYAALALTGTRTPLVVHLRDRVEPAALGRLGHVAFRRFAVRRATGFIANSESTAQTVRRLLRPGQFVEVVPSPIGVDRVVTAPEVRREETVRIGMVARLDPWKGHEELIRAYALAGVDGEASLTLVGGAPFAQEAYARRLAHLVSELGLRNVSFTGHRDDVREQIDALDVCVQFSTRPEPLGQNVLQYLARGRTVVAAAEGGPREWIVDGRNGILVPPNDVAGLAAVLRRTVEDASLRATLSAGAIATAGLPDDCAIARRHAEVFARAAGGR